LSLVFQMEFLSVYNLLRFCVLSSLSVFLLAYSEVWDFVGVP